MRRQPDPPVAGQSASGQILLRHYFKSLGYLAKFWPISMLKVPGLAVIYAKVGEAGYGRE
jgi:hypothetical protein